MVTDEYPWPTRTGYRQRIDRVLRALAAEADVDLFVVVFDDVRTGDRAPEQLTLRRQETVVAGRRAEPRVRRAATWLVDKEPRALGWRDWTAARTALARWPRTTYDAVWFSHANTYLALGDLVAGPQVVDLDNLNSFLLRHRRAMLRHTRPPSLRGRARRAAQLVVDRVDERRWARVERRIADRASAVVVCSDLDRERLGRPNVKVVENGYELPEPTGPELRSGLRSAPVLLTVGLLTYEPNRDAAAFFAREVLPRVRAELPGAQFRVVGRYSDESHVAAFQGLPGVTVTGEVPDISTELRGADVVVAPIRFGGGTRIKILEAFANRLPVVTTTVGAEGLKAVDGKHLLVADDARSFADACVRVLGDARLRDGLASAGHQLWEQRHRGVTIAPTIAAVVHEAMGG